MNKKELENIILEHIRQQNNGISPIFLRKYIQKNNDFEIESGDIRSAIARLADKNLIYYDHELKIHFNEKIKQYEANNIFKK